MEALTRLAELVNCNLLHSEGHCVLEGASSVIVCPLQKSCSMTNHITKRPMSESEREFLNQVLKSSKGGVARWVRGGENALVTWAGLTLLFVLASLLISWAIRAILHIQIGLDSIAGLWVITLGTLACATYAVVSSVRWVKAWQDMRPEIRADLEGGQVLEESYQFTAAKRFQEPEHGGLFYFLRTTDDKVMVIYDQESQDLGVQGEDPLKSSFQPCTELRIIRAPRTQYVIGKQFSGAALDAGAPRELTLAPESWPESETFCKIRWDDLEGRLSRKGKRK